MAASDDTRWTQTTPFTSDMTINGPIEADVWLKTTGFDAAIVVTVTDVAPDGTSPTLSNGLLLASHRAVDPTRSRMVDGMSIQTWHPFTQAAKQPVRFGQPMLLPVEIFPASAVIAAGHRLRVAIAPADFPRAMATGPAQINSLAGVATVLSDPSHPTSITLPVE